MLKNLTKKKINNKRISKRTNVFRYKKQSGGNICQLFTDKNSKEQSERLNNTAPGQITGIHQKSIQPPIVSKKPTAAPITDLATGASKERYTITNTNTPNEDTNRQESVITKQQNEAYKQQLLKLGKATKKAMVGVDQRRAAQKLEAQKLEAQTREAQTREAQNAALNKEVVSQYPEDLYPDPAEVKAQFLKTRELRTIAHQKIINNKKNKELKLETNRRQKIVKREARATKQYANSQRNRAEYLQSQAAKAAKAEEKAAAKAAKEAEKAAKKAAKEEPVIEDIKPNDIKTRLQKARETRNAAFKNAQSRGLNNEKKAPARNIDHIWFKNWPDNGVPVMSSFEIFINYVFEDMQTTKGDTVIHCSAGVGRTGVVYVILKLLSKGYKYNSIKDTAQKTLLKSEIDKIINKERHNRHKFFVKEDIQYNFIYKYFTGEDMDNYSDEFQHLLQTECEQPTVTMGDKNRYTNIIPCESSRVKLDDDTYINASNLTPLYFGILKRKPIKIIATQCPHNSGTIKDFYKMLKEKNIKRIVMVTGLIEE